MPSTTPRPPTSTQAIDLIDDINRNLRRCEDLADMLAVLADCASHQMPRAEVAMGAWAGVWLVQEKIGEGVTIAKTKAHELYELAMALDDKGRAR
jgi:hypothetical protein